jgi:hypothetical protein
MRDLKSPFSYNLWSFDMAPDRFGPRDEDEVWRDIGRLWSEIKDVNLLERFLMMVCDPPMLLSDESHSVSMSSWYLGTNPVSKDKYTKTMEDNAQYWQKAWDNVFFEMDETGNRIPMVLRTDEAIDGIVKHLGYRSRGVSWNLRESLSTVIKTDRKLLAESQERLREVQAVPEGLLNDAQKAHLALARQISNDIDESKTLGGVQAAQIPPASDRTRTAGLYSRTTREIFISLEQLMRGRSTIDTTIHELAHHTSGAEDAEKGHYEAISHVAADVVRNTSGGTYDELIKAEGFRW